MSDTPKGNEAMGEHLARLYGKNAGILALVHSLAAMLEAFDEISRGPSDLRMTLAKLREGVRNAEKAVAISKADPSLARLREITESQALYGQAIEADLAAQLRD